MLDNSFFSKTLVKTLLVATTLCWLAPPMDAAPGSYAQAVSDFQARKYSQALGGFQNASRANPNDAMCHYYMALCYQYMNQVGFATREYQWVASNSRSAQLKAQAEAGLGQLQKYQSSRQIQLASNITPATGSMIGGTTAAAARPSSFARGRLKVTEFYTTWCHVCKSFEPVFSQVQSSSKYRSACDFQQLDAEDPSNSGLVSKYGIRSYPTVIFADASGKQVTRFSGGTSAEGLSSLIDGSLAQLPK